MKLFGFTFQKIGPMGGELSKAPSGKAATFLVACLLTPLVPILGHLNRPRIERVLERLARVG